MATEHELTLLIKITELAISGKKNKYTRIMFLLFYPAEEICILQLR